MIVLASIYGGSILRLFDLLGEFSRNDLTRLNAQAARARRPPWE